MYTILERLDRIESKLGSHSQYNYRGVRDLKDQMWRFKIKTQISKKIELEYDRLIRVEYTSEDDKSSRSSKFLDIVFRYMLVEYCLLTNNTSPSDAPNPSLLCKTQASNLNRLLEFLTKTAINGQGDFLLGNATSFLMFDAYLINRRGERFVLSESEAKRTRYSWKYGRILFDPNLSVEPRADFLGKILHLAVMDEHYEKFVARIESKCKPNSSLTPFFAPVIARDRSMKLARQTVAKDLPDHAHMVNSQNLLQPTLEEDMEDFIKDFKDFIDDSAVIRAAEEGVRAVFNDSPLTFEARRTVLQNVMKDFE